MNLAEDGNANVKGRIPIPALVEPFSYHCRPAIVYEANYVFTSNMNIFSTVHTPTEFNISIRNDSPKKAPRLCRLSDIVIVVFSCERKWGVLCEGHVALLVF